jgi:hypothetical protein
MNMNDLINPNNEGKEKILAEVKESFDVANELDVNGASALVTLVNLDILEENGFLKTNVDLMTDEGREIAKSLVEKDYPLDVMSVMGVLTELFGDSMGENDAMMMTDMVLTCSTKGIAELEKMAEEYEAEEAKKSEEGSADSGEETDKPDA